MNITSIDWKSIQEKYPSGRWEMLDRLFTIIMQSLIHELTDEDLLYVGDYGICRRNITEDCKCRRWGWYGWLRTMTHQYEQCIDIKQEYLPNEPLDEITKAINAVFSYEILRRTNEAIK